MPRLSAVLITYNEESDLPEALSSLEGIADEIVVVDSGSTDRTCEIARAAGARAISRAFTDFGDQKNFAASQASHDWVLSLDADERLSPELRQTLTAWKQHEPDGAAFEMSRKTNYLGGWITHSGWYPEYCVRLYRRDCARFVGALHESVHIQGQVPERVGRLPGEIHHYSIRSLAEHYDKMDAFTTRAAEDLYSRGRRRWRAGMWTAAPWTLLQKFFFQLGFLDGYRGALIAWTSARYVWLKYRKLGVLARGGTLQHRAWPQARGA
jgi:glycosyltransferase involved in cell wall biosynthesis